MKKVPREDCVEAWGVEAGDLKDELIVRRSWTEYTASREAIERNRQEGGVRWLPIRVYIPPSNWWLP